MVGRICENWILSPERRSEEVVDDESGQSTEKDEVTGVWRGGYKERLIRRLSNRDQELILPVVLPILVNKRCIYSGVKVEHIDTRCKAKPVSSPPAYSSGRLLIIVNWSVNWFDCVHRVR